MSVGTVDNKTTTYFVDGGKTNIEVPAGVYEASSTANLTLGDESGNSFTVSTDTQEFCAQDGLSKVLGSSPLSPLEWRTPVFDSSLNAKTIAGVWETGNGYGGVASDMATISSTNGKYFTLGDEYNPTYDAPSVIWTTGYDFQAIPGGQITFPTSPSLQEGDIVIVSVGSDESTPNLPSGWTSIEDSTVGAGYGRTFYKVMTATPDANVYVDGLTEAAAGVAMAVRNVGSDGNGLKLSYEVSSGSTGMPNAPAVTTTEPNSLVAIFGRVDDDSVASSVTVPSGFSNLVVAEAAGLTGQTAMAATQLVADSGTTIDPDAFGGTGNDDTRAISILLGPTPYFAGITDAQKLDTDYYATSLTGDIAKSTDLSEWSLKIKSGTAVPELKYVYRSNLSENNLQNDPNYTRDWSPNLGSNTKPGDVVFMQVGSYVYAPETTSEDVELVTLQTNLYSSTYNHTYYFVIPSDYNYSEMGNTPYSFQTRLGSNNSYDDFVVQYIIYRNVNLETISSVSYDDYATPNFPALGPVSDSTMQAAIWWSAGNNSNAYYDKNISGWSDLYSKNTDRMRIDGIYSSSFLSPGESTPSGNLLTSVQSYHYAWVGIMFSAKEATEGWKFAHNGNGTVVGVRGIEIAYSTDNGESFTVITNPPQGKTTNINSIVYSNGQFVIGIDDSKLFRSSNGSSWSQVNFGSTEDSPIVNVSHAGGVAYATLTTGSYLYSTDGFDNYTYRSMLSGEGGAAGGSDGTVQFVGTTQWAGDDDANEYVYSSFGRGYGPKHSVQKGDLIIAGLASDSSSYWFDMRDPGNGWKILERRQNDDGIQSSNGLNIQTYYKFLGEEDTPNITLEAFYQFVYDTSVNSQGVREASFNVSVFRNVDPSQPIQYQSVYDNSTMHVAYFDPINKPFMELKVAHSENSFNNTPSTNHSTWTGYENMEYISNNDGSVVSTTQWFPNGGQTGTEFWRDSGGSNVESANYASYSVVMYPIPASTVADDGEEATNSIASVYGQRGTQILAVGGGGAVMEVASGGALTTYLATNIGGAGFKKLLSVGNQYLAVGNDKTIKYSGQISETATLKLIGQVVKV